MTPTVTNQSSTFFLNYTALNDTLSPVAVLVGAAPRWLLLADVYNPDNANITTTSILLVIDTVLEAVLSLFHLLLTLHHPFNVSSCFIIVVSRLG